MGAFVAGQDNKQISILVPRYLYLRLRSAAANKKVSVQSLLRPMVLRYAEKLEPVDGELHNG
jgi:hypothetical protein